MSRRPVTGGAGVLDEPVHPISLLQWGCMCGVFLTVALYTDGLLVGSRESCVHGVS